MLLLKNKKNYLQIFLKKKNMLSGALILCARFVTNSYHVSTYVGDPVHYNIELHNVLAQTDRQINRERGSTCISQSLSHTKYI